MKLGQLFRRHTSPLQTITARLGVTVHPGLLARVAPPRRWHRRKSTPGTPNGSDLDVTKLRVDPESLM